MTSGAWIGMGIALAVLCVFVSLTDDTLLSPSLLYGETKGEDLPDKAPAGCEECQDALDTYWDLKNYVDGLPYIPPYLQDEIDAARQAYLDCISDCGPEPTPEPEATPTCEDLYGDSGLALTANPGELGSGCVVRLAAYVDTLPQKHIVRWSCGGEGERIDRAVSGDGEQEVTADLYVYCRGDYVKMASSSCSYTVHDPPYSVTGPSYSVHEKEAEAICVLICECASGSPGECPLTVLFDREECRTVTFKCGISGEIGLKAIAAVKGSLGWGWDKQICVSSHAGTTVDVPCGWKYVVTATIFKDRAFGSIKTYSCTGQTEEIEYEACNYAIEIRGKWKELK